MSATAVPSSYEAGFWRRLNHTPLRDLMRGRVTGRNDVEALLARAGLPGPLTDVVRRVVKRTRLRPGERVDVARELCAHFADGLVAGSAADRLQQQFGDERQAARLIRRAKQRGRHWVWRAGSRLVRGVAGLVALLIVVYLVQAVRLYIEAPQLRHNYLHEWNARAQAVPVEERAWPVYREALAALTPVPKLKWREDARPGGAAWTEVAAWAAANAGVVERLRAAATKPHMGVVLGDMADEALARRLQEGRSWPAPANRENPAAWDIPLPQASLLNLGHRLLVADAWLGVEARDGARVAADALAMLEMSRQLREIRVLIADLVAERRFQETCQFLRSALRESPELIARDDLVRLAHRVAGVGAEVCRVQYASERDCFADMLQRYYTDDGHGDGLARTDRMMLGPAEPGAGMPDWGARLAAPAAATVLMGRREVQAVFDETMAGYEREAVPLWQYGGSPTQKRIERLGSLERLRAAPLYLWLPALSRVHLLSEYARQEGDATQVALAATLWRQQTGQWPAALAELVPQWLPAVPPDRYDGQALKYRVVAGQPVLYSIGNDRKDNGGRLPVKHTRIAVWEWYPAGAPPAAMRDETRPLPDGDWVLWPVPQ